MNVRRPPAVSVRVLMLAVTAVGLGLGWYEPGVRRQRDAVEAIRRAGGRVVYDDEPRGMVRPGTRPARSPGGGRRFWEPRWLVDRVGIDHFRHPVQVVLPARVGRVEEVLAHVGRLHRLETLVVFAGVTSDEALAPLLGLASLKRLELTGAAIGDQGFTYLRAWPGLRILRVGGSRVGDRGLAFVAAMTELEYLSLEDSRVTDAGLVHLQKLDMLKQLDLGGTRVDFLGEGIREYRRIRPKVRVTGNPMEFN